jgi:predicted phosphoadenosine phosphosulfate sulfurtransferase
MNAIRPRIERLIEQLAEIATSYAPVVLLDRGLQADQFLKALIHTHQLPIAVNNSVSNHRALIVSHRNHSPYPVASVKPIYRDPDTDVYWFYPLWDWSAADVAQALQESLDEHTYAQAA